MDSRGYYIESCNQHWGHSPLVGGKLQLRANAASMEYTHNAIKFYPGGYWGPDSNTIAYLPNGLKWSGLLASSYSKFRGRLYQGSASLGVTLGSMKQSQDMIAKRSRSITAQAAELFEQLLSSPKAQKQLRENPGKPLGALNALSSVHLEVIFGWQPLLSDIHAACTTVIQQADKTVWVSASSEGSQTDITRVPYPPIRIAEKISRMRVTRSAGVRISNPNLWLAERAGLVNPASVAWDLVPWSFVVNMFSNVGQIVNSMTDFAGLTFSNSSLTQSCKIYYGWRSFNPDGSTGVEMLSRGSFLYRSGQADARPPLVIRPPELNWGTAAMAASLAVGRVSALSRFIH